MASENLCMIFGHRGQDGTLMRQSLEGKSRVIGVGREVIEHFNVSGKIVSSQPRPDSFKKFFEENQPTKIFYLAANHRSSEVASKGGYSADFESFFLGNVIPYANVLSDFSQAEIDAHLLYASSSQVFAGNRSKKLDEESAMRPRNFYAMAKAHGLWLGDKYRTDRGKTVSSLILFNHESGRRPEGFLSTKVIRAALRIANGSAETVHIRDPNVLVDWGSAKDFVNCFLAVADREKGDNYIVATGEQHSVGEFSNLVFQALGLKLLDHAKFGTENMEVEPSLGIADITKVRSVVGWRPSVSFEQLVEDLVSAHNQPDYRH